MIYLDHHAATPLAPGVSRAMRDAEHVAWANPSSAHAAGRAARRVMETARSLVAESIGSDSADVVFTAGGTEACNLGVLGIVAEPSRIVTTGVEHPAVQAAVAELARRGSRVTHLQTKDGMPTSVAEFSNALHGAGERVLVAVQWVNHETGLIWPIEAYANVCRQAGAALFVDATQAWGKLPIRVKALGATALAIAGHKAGGPAGTGALWVERGVAVEARAIGGGQERGRRAGSPAPEALAGFGAAAQRIAERIAAMPAIAARRDRLEAEVIARGGISNGSEAPRVATVSNISLPGRTGPALVAALDLEGIACSSGAACSSGVNAPSPVLRALYPAEPWRADSAIRFSFGPEVLDSEVDSAVRSLQIVLSRPPA